MTAKTASRTKGRTAAPRCYVAHCGGASRPGHFTTAKHREALRLSKPDLGGPADENRGRVNISRAAEDRHWQMEEERSRGQRGDDLAWLIERGPLPEPPTVLYPEAMAKITLRDAAERLGVRPGTLRMAIRRNRMVGHKLGRDWLVEESEVRYYELTRLGRVGYPKGRPRKSA